MEYLSFLPTRHTFLLLWATAPPFSSGGPSSMSLAQYIGVSMGLTLTLEVRESTQSSLAHHSAKGAWEEGVTGPKPGHWDKEKVQFVLQMLCEETCWSVFAYTGKALPRESNDYEGRESLTDGVGMNSDDILWVHKSLSWYLHTIFC